jgi:hypothetical protein
MKNWRTTLIGGIAAAATAAAGVAQMTNGQFDNKQGWLSMASAVFMALLGYVAKDAGVSGSEK